MTQSSVKKISKNTFCQRALPGVGVWIFLFFFCCSFNLLGDKAYAEDPFYLFDNVLKEYADELSKPIKKHKKFISKLDLSGAKGEDDLRKRIAQLKESVEEIVREYDSIASERSSKVPGFCADLFSADLYWVVQERIVQAKLPASLAPEVRDAINRELSALARGYLERAVFHYERAVTLSKSLELSDHAAVKAARARLFDVETMAPDLR